MKNKAAYVSFFLRLGLAFPFFYVGVSSIKTPDDWMGFMPVWALRIGRDLFGKGGDGTMLLVFSVAEIILATWLMSGKKTRVAGFVSFLVLVAIVIADPAAFPITFRDVGLACAALALAFL